MDGSTALRPNTLAFIALCNEYCAAVQDTRNIGYEDSASFVATMLRLLPRIYICAADLEIRPGDNDNKGYGGDLLYPDQEDDIYIDSFLDEDYYDTIRRNVGNILGEDDTYLEVFHQDMKYSDTPIAASVSEGIADLFQVFYNFLETVRDAPDRIVSGAVATMAEDFANYWSAILCNILRALNHIRYNG